MESIAGKLLWSGAVLSVTAMPVLAAIVVLGRLKVRRVFRQRMRPGDELSSHFGPSSLVLTTPSAKHEHSYSDVTSVRKVGNWVHLKHAGEALPSVWPAAIFPEHELERLQEPRDGKTAS